MKLLLNIFCFLIFLLSAFNAVALPQKDGIKYGVFDYAQTPESNSAETSIDANQICMLSVDYLYVFQKSIENPKESYSMVEIGKQADSSPMETDYGNYRVNDYGYTTTHLTLTLNYKNRGTIGHIYIRPVIYKNLTPDLTGKNFGFSCGGQGDNLSGGFDSTQSPKVHI